MWSVEPQSVSLQTLGTWAVPLLCDSAIKAAVLLTAVTMLAFAWRGTSSAVRHLIWLLALAALPLLPLAMLVAPGWNALPVWATPLTWSHETIGPSVVADPIQARTIYPSAGPSDVSPAGPVAQATVASTDAIQVLIIAVWGLGMVLVIAPWVLGRLSLWQLERRAQSIEQGSIAALAARLRKQLNIRREVRLLLSRHRNMPMQWGFVRPRILLPKEAESWPEDRLSAVLLHELAHVRRFDCLSQLTARIVISLYWFHPLVWWARRRLDIESELACDDLTVTTSPRDAVDYAEHLLFVAAHASLTHNGYAGAICMARPSRLEERLRAILDGHRNRRGLSLAGRSGCLAMMVAVSLPLALLRAEPPSEDELVGPTSHHESAIEPGTQDSLDQDHQGSIPIKRGYVDETAEGKRSLGGSGHAVRFQRGEDAQRLMAVEIFASRYGYPQAPEEDFHLYVLDEDQQLIQAIPFPYAMIERGKERWYTLKLPGVQVPERFYVALSFNPHRTKGVYLGLDESVKQSHSYVGRPTSGYQPVTDSYDWMIRAVLAGAQPTKNPFELSE